MVLVVSMGVTGDWGSVCLLSLYRSIVEDPSVPAWGLHKLISWKFQLLWIEFARVASGEGAECWKPTYSKLRK